LSDMADFMRTHPAHEHLGEGFSHLWCVTLVALEDLRLESSFAIVFALSNPQCLRLQCPDRACRNHCGSHGAFAP
jgi:hypothetical protein